MPPAVARVASPPALATCDMNIAHVSQVDGSCRRPCGLVPHDSTQSPEPRPSRRPWLRARARGDSESTRWPLCHSTGCALLAPLFACFLVFEPTPIQALLVVPLLEFLYFQKDINYILKLDSSARRVHPPDLDPALNHLSARIRAAGHPKNHDPSHESRVRRPSHESNHRRGRAASARVRGRLSPALQARSAGTGAAVDGGRGCRRCLPASSRAQPGRVASPPALATCAMNRAQVAIGVGWAVSRAQPGPRAAGRAARARVSARLQGPVAASRAGVAGPPPTRSASRTCTKREGAAVIPGPRPWRLGGRE